MKFCSTCGAELHDNAVVCVKCGCAVTPPPSQTPDTRSKALNFASFICPIAGFILYGVLKDKTPIRAKGCKKWAILGLVIGGLLTIFAAAATSGV